MNWGRISIVVVILTTSVALFWFSPFSLGLRLKYGVINRNGPMMLAAANQLSWWRSDDPASVQESVEIRLAVVRNEMSYSAKLIDEMIAKDPNDTGLLLMRARVRIMNGQRDGALADLITAKEQAVRNPASKKFQPSPSLIDEMIADLQKRK